MEVGEGVELRNEARFYRFEDVFRELGVLGDLQSAEIWEVVRVKEFGIRQDSGGIAAFIGNLRYRERIDTRHIKWLGQPNGIAWVAEIGLRVSIDVKEDNPKPF